MTKPPSKRRIVADKRYSAAQPTAPQPPRGGRGGKRAPVRRGNPVANAVAGFFSLIWRIIWGTFWRLGFAVALIMGISTFYYYAQLPEPQALFDGRARGSVTMLDRDGRVFAWRGETFGTVTEDHIAPVLRDAVISVEDRRFYNHLGISPRGIAGAIRTNMAAGRGPLEGAGGSTITQQVAKLLCLGETYDPIKWRDEAAYEADCRESSVWRKIKELPFAFAMEAKYSKDDILNIYMNRAYLGGGARGFEAAAQRYFGKNATEVNAAEAAMLAGLLRAPSYFAPTSNLSRAQDRASLVLSLMHEQGRLTDAQYADARANPAQLSRAAAARAGGYFADWLMESGPGFLTTETTEDVTILTTFDQRVQRAAERALAQVFEDRVRDGSQAQAAVVVMSADGAVRAMIGGRDTTTTGAFNRATQAMRQTGSSFKPFVFAAALDQGMTPNSTVQDAPLTINIRGGRPWSPQNYTRNYRGEISLTTALAQSINTSTIRLQEAAGRDQVRRIAQDFGVGSNLPNVPSLGLGALESTLLDMTGAYAGIRNGGRAVRPYGIAELRIAGDDRPLINQYGGMGERVISQKAAGELIQMMQAVIENGTGTRARLAGRPVAGKTGTTSSYRDAWFIGFTEQYVTGVWMGYDDNTPLTGVTGGGLPAEIWQAVMAEIHDGLPALPLGGFVADSAGPRIVDVPGDEGGVDPLAAALGQALGQGGAPAPQPAAQPATAPQTPAQTIGSSPSDPPRRVRVEPPPDSATEDLLSDVLRNIEGLY
ncbi:MAG: transglycosylase domain-containing protein [Paracoccus sp. (in: a-proteobacteria)]|nr:transglycosylase domain-containing protein [Paracoccus sp. (in: a-proteobacteria)]